MEAAIYNRLSTDPNITGLVGTRIFPVIPSQDTALPYVVYFQSGAEPVMHLNGVSNLTKYELRVEFWADAFDAVADLGKKIRTNLDGFRGTAAGITLQGVFLVEESNEQEPDAYHGSQLYWVWAAES